MSYTAQAIIVATIVGAAIALAGRSAYRAINNKKSALNPCNSCKIKDTCAKNKKDCNNATY